MATTTKSAEAVKLRAIKLAATTAEKADAAENERNATLLYAHDSGASLRELQDATGIPYVTIKRIIDRQRA